MVSELLKQEYQRLNQCLQELQQQGIAPTDSWLSPNRRQTKKGGVRVYWRLNHKTEHGTVTDYLGIEGSIQHREWVGRIERRNQVSELKMQMQLLDQLMNRQAAA